MKMDHTTWQSVVGHLASLVESEDTEAPIQDFLERNPGLICADDRFPNRHCVISQFPLGADFKADFAYLCHDSRSYKLHMIEIERPTIPVFTSSDEWAQAYNHALHQLEDWSSWCYNNMDALRNILSPLVDGHWHGQGFVPRCRLIAGRRSQLSNTARQRRYSAKDEFLDKNISIETYDHFIESLSRMPSDPILLSDILCVTYKNQKYFEKAVDRR